MSFIEILWLIGCIVSGLGAVILWINGDKIVRTPYWPLGFIGYLVLVVTSFNCYANAFLTIKPPVL